MQAHRRRLAYLVTNSLLFCALAGLFVALLSLTITPEYPVDDAYISFRYASNWADGYGPVFNPGERVEGYSSFLWVTFLALAERVGISAPLAARLISMIAGLAILWILLSWSSGLVSNLGSWLACIGAAFFVAVSPSTTFNVLSGLEAPLVALLVLLGVYSLQTRFHPFFSAFVLLLLSLVRPEGIFVALAMVTVDLASRIIRGTDRTHIQKVVAAWVLGMIVPYAIYLGWRLWFYGYPLPNTIYAKSGFPLEVQLSRSTAYIKGFAELYWPLLLIAANGLFGIKDQMTRNAFAATIALALTVLVIGSGDPYPHWRYLYPLLPLAALLAAKGIQIIAPKLSGFQAPELRKKNLRENLRFYFGVSGVIFLAIIQASMIADKTRIPETALLSRVQQGTALLVSQDRRPHLDAENPFGLNLHYLAAWLTANSSPLDALATSEVGVVAYYSDVRVLDTFGLVNEYIAHLPGVPGGKMDTDYVFTQRPRFIAFKVDNSCICGGIPADNQILTDWRLQRDYDLVRIFPAGYAKLLLFRLRDTPAFQAYYDFTHEFSYEAVTFVRSDGETTSNLQLARELTGNQIVTRFMTDEQRMQGINALALAEEAASPDFLAADTMRSWLRNWRRLLYHYPYTNELRPEIHYSLQIPANAVLKFGLGQAPEFWDSKYGDGVLYEIDLIEASGDEVIIFSHYLDAKNNPGDRGWQDFTVDLSPWAGRTITLSFVASPGENNNRDYDFGGWGQPQILIAYAP